jgi:malonate transporter MadL subunit
LVIYGVALLSICLIGGLFVGEVLGKIIGVQANVGGVGIAMLLLIFLSDVLRKRSRLTEVSQRGVVFWSSIYIPVVVAMAAKQNVLGAVKGGPAALLAGALAVAVCFAFVPLISRIGSKSTAASGDQPAGNDR